MTASDKLQRVHHRMPTVFGPFPGPRQSFDGFRRDGSQSKNVEAFISFETTKADLADLLPRGFTFQNTSAADQRAFVTVATKRLDNLNWLSGRGYNLYSFSIHGVKYVGAGGKEHPGTFLPVLWEDMADPIISGREELGFPKLFADIAMKRTHDSYSMAASWQGSCFAELTLNDLQEVEPRPSQLAPPEAGTDDGLLLYRRMPATGRAGIAETSYTVFVSHKVERELQQAKLARRFSCANGEFKWYPLDWHSLPTLHHIVRRLAQVPVLAIVGFGVTEKSGGADPSSEFKLDDRQETSGTLIESKL